MPQNKAFEPGLQAVDAVARYPRRLDGDAQAPGQTAGGRGVGAGPLMPAYEERQAEGSSSSSMFYRPSGADLDPRDGQVVLSDPEEWEEPELVKAQAQPQPQAQAQAQGQAQGQDQMMQASAPPRGLGAAAGNGGGNGESGTAGDASLPTARPGDAQDAVGQPQAASQGVPGAVDAAGGQVSPQVQYLTAKQMQNLYERSHQIKKEARSREEAEAMLTQNGLSPETLQELVRRGYLSPDHGQRLNGLINGGYASYEEGRRMEAIQQREQSVWDIHRRSQTNAGDYARAGTSDAIQSWLSKGDFDRDNLITLKAKELGVSEEALRQRMESLRAHDWSVPYTQEASKKQNGKLYGLGRKLGLVDLAEPVRVLPDGSILPNPELGKDRAAFDAAIDAAPGSAEAKTRAKGLWDKYYDNYLSAARSALESEAPLPSGRSYMQWRERTIEEGRVNGRSENQLAEEYMKKQKDRGWLERQADNISRNFLAGSHELMAGLAGTAAWATGDQALAETAMRKKGEAEATTAGLQHTGNDGVVSGMIGVAARALPGAAAVGASGGTVGGALTAFALGTGNTYAELYEHHLNQKMTPEQAREAAFGTAMDTGAFSAALGGLFPGGASALTNTATREAARQGMGTVLKHFLKGAVKEVPEELVDSAYGHMAVELNKGRSVNEAVGSLLENMQESMGGAGLMGGGLRVAGNATKGPRPQDQAHPPLPQHVAPVPAAAGAEADTGGRQPPPAGASQPHSGSANRAMPMPKAEAQPPVPVPGVRASMLPPSAQGGRPSPASTASPGAGPDKQPTTIVNNGQAPSASPSGQPPQTAAVPVGNGKPETTMLKEDGQAPMPESGSGPAHPTPTVANSGQPPQTPPSGPPRSVESSRRLIDNVMARPEHARQHPTVQADLAQAQAVVAAAEGRAAQDLDQARSRPRPSPDQPPAHDGRTHPGDTSASGRTSIHADANAQVGINTDARRNLNADANTNPPTAANPDGGAATAPHGGSAARGHMNAHTRSSANTHDSAPAPTPGQPQQPSPLSTPGAGLAHPPPMTGNSGPPPSASAPSGQPSQTTANNSQPPQTPPSGHPSGPPRSVESSRRLIANLMARPEHARQHPTVQADLAQARAVVAGADGWYTQADQDTFRDDREEGISRDVSPLVARDSVYSSKSTRSNQPSVRGELTYWTEYYKKAGRQKDNLDSLIEKIQRYNDSLKGAQDHLPIFVEEDMVEGASYAWKRDRAGKIVGHLITYGASTKKWELLEEFAHYRVSQGWKKAEIKDLRKKLRKLSYGEKGEREGIVEPRRAAEEIIVKQHLLDHVSSLTEPERELLQNQIKQLYRHGLRYGY